MDVFPSSGEGWETPTCVATPHLKTETDPVSETLRYFVLLTIPDDGQSPKKTANPDSVGCLVF
jgi:hypothetical protein